MAEQDDFAARRRHVISAYKQAQPLGHFHHFIVFGLVITSIGSAMFAYGALNPTEGFRTTSTSQLVGWGIFIASAGQILLFTGIYQLLANLRVFFAINRISSTPESPLIYDLLD